MVKAPLLPARGATGQRLRQIAGLIPANDRRALALAAFLALLTGGLTILGLALLAQLLNAANASFAGPAPQGRIWGLLGLMGLAILGRETCRLLGRYLVQSRSIRLGKELTIALAARQHRADLAALGAEPVGARVGRLLAAAKWFERTLRLVFLDLLPNVCTLVFALAFALATQPWIGLLLLGVIPAALCIEMHQMARDRGAHAEVLQCKDRLDGALVEQFGGIEHVRAANTRQREIARLAGILEAWRSKQLRLYLRTLVFSSLRITSGWLFQFGVIGVAVALSGMGKMPITDIAVYGNLFFSVYLPLWGIHFALSEARENAPRQGDLLAGLVEPADRSFAPAASSEPLAVPGNGEVLLETRALVVEYRGHAGSHRALDRVSVQINAGEIVGIAGRSGSGKSTLVKVLLRLVHPTAGDACLAGVPLEAVSRTALSRLVGYLGQEPYLFAGTIAENIALGRETASRAAIRRAAMQVGLHDEIMRKPGGYDAAVGERGRNLSGGQRQRLALARVFLHDAPVLVLDEATAALDPANEQRVLRALRKSHPRRTVLLVAHRPAALQATDRVLVFDDGCLVEDGPYEELLQQGRVLAELVGKGSRTPAVAGPNCLRVRSSVAPG
jgi:ATP-binding cassette subfamily B protein